MDCLKTLSCEKIYSMGISWENWLVIFLSYENKVLNDKYKHTINNLGRYLGFKYPDGDCDEMVQRYISKK